MKKILNSFMYFFIFLFIGTLVVTLINYFSIFNSNIVSVMRFCVPMIATTITSYKLGKSSDKKGYLAGLKFGGIIILFFIFLVIILDKLVFKSIFYYLILLLNSIVSSMIGINRKN